MKQRRPAQQFSFQWMAISVDGLVASRGLKGRRQHSWTLHHPAPAFWVFVANGWLLQSLATKMQAYQAQKERKQVCIRAGGQVCQ